MNDETKKRLSQLVEINRALAHDLDVSRRIVAELGNERDALKDRVERLESEVEVAGSGLEHQGQLSAKKILGELKEVRGIMKEVREERDCALRGVEAATARANKAEDKLKAMASRMNELEKERDIYMLKVDEMAEAMIEIRYRLSELPRNEFAKGLSW